MSIHLIRHGQSEFNAKYTGRDLMIFDAPLTELGQSQALATREAVAALGITQVICSPLTRALQTARLIFPTDPISVMAEAREHLGHSCDVGIAPTALQSNWPDIAFDHLPEVWWHQGPLNAVGIPEEPWDVFKARVAQLGQDLREDLRASDGRPIALVCHGHVIHALTGVQPDNCQIVELPD